MSSCCKGLYVEFFVCLYVELLQGVVWVGMPLLGQGLRVCMPLSGRYKSHCKYTTPYQLVSDTTPYLPEGPHKNTQSLAKKKKHYQKMICKCTAPYLYLPKSHIKHTNPCQKKMSYQKVICKYRSPYPKVTYKHTNPFLECAKRRHTSTQTLFLSVPKGDIQAHKQQRMSYKHTNNSVCCCMLLYVVVCCCMLLYVVVCCCCMLLYVVVCCCCMLLYVVVCCCMLLYAVVNNSFISYSMFCGQFQKKIKK
jgi:hypothetical protein